MTTFWIITAAVAVGYLVFRFDRHLSSLPKKTVAELRAILAGPASRSYPGALSELQRRGEDITNESLRVCQLMISDSAFDRIQGWALLKEFYPEFAERLPDYKPHDRPEKCREAMRDLLS
jgi:hypothetical protein